MQINILLFGNLLLIKFLTPADVLALESSVQQLHMEWFFGIMISPISSKNIWKITSSVNWKYFSFLLNYRIYFSDQNLLECKFSLISFWNFLFEISKIFFLDGDDTNRDNMEVEMFDWWDTTWYEIYIEQITYIVVHN